MIPGDKVKNSDEYIFGDVTQKQVTYLLSTLLPKYVLLE